MHFYFNRKSKFLEDNHVNFYGTAAYDVKYETYFRRQLSKNPNNCALLSHSFADVNYGCVFLRQPGIEPGSTAWKATMLTFTPLTL